MAHGAVADSDTVEGTSACLRSRSGTVLRRLRGHARTNPTRGSVRSVQCVRGRAPELYSISMP
eukprot:5458160-Prymnesium_polylepis.2